MQPRKRLYATHTSRQVSIRLKPRIDVSILKHTVCQSDIPQKIQLLIWCVGTGTPAGDPQEAEAIASAFFDGRKLNVDEEPLYVGSVKTVIGHTEGTAGLAGLLKVSLAMRHGIIPPNLLFEELSPNVAPFYHNMNIVTSPQAWPKLNPGTPRRASVNSFGMVYLPPEESVKRFSI